MTQVRGGVLLDTGVLVALLLKDDPRHEAASDWLASCHAPLCTVEPVLAETAFFLPASQRGAVADLAATGVVQVRHPDASGFKRIAALLRKYADLRPDWADAALVWLAEECGIQRIATLDVRDFSAYRINGRSKFVLEAIA